METHWENNILSSKLMISSRDYYWYKLRRLSGTSCKYTCISRIPPVMSPVSSKRHWSLRELKENSSWDSIKIESLVHLSMPLKLVDLFIYFGSHISSTENNVITRLTKMSYLISLIKYSKKQCSPYRSYQKNKTYHLL